jgi:hypothetical protein
MNEKLFWWYLAAQSIKLATKKETFNLPAINMQYLSVRRQFTVHNSPRAIRRSTIHHEKKNPLDEFLILLD